MWGAAAAAAAALRRLPGRRGWEPISMTTGKRSGRGARPAKRILVKALDPEFRGIMKGEAKQRPMCRAPLQIYSVL